MTPLDQRPWWRPAAYALIGLSIGLAVAVLLAAIAVIGQIRSTQLDGTPTGKKLVASADRILDCTEAGDAKKGKPAGDCYQRSQRQTAAILTSAQRIIIISAACSANVATGQTVDQRIAAITACVTERLTNPGS